MYYATNRIGTFVSGFSLWRFSLTVLSVELDSRNIKQEKGNNNKTNHGMCEYFSPTLHFQYDNDIQSFNIPKFKGNKKNSSEARCQITLRKTFEFRIVGAALNWTKCNNTDRIVQTKIKILSSCCVGKIRSEKLKF